MLAPWLVTLSLALASADADEVTLKFADCPAAVRKGLQAEVPSAKFESVTRETDDENETIFWADAVVGEKTYTLGVLVDGTLSEMSLAFDDEEVPLAKCPEAVRKTFEAEAFGEKVDLVGKQMKYGTTLYEAVVPHKARMYFLSIAEDGTLHEKVLVIDDEEVELGDCPAAVQGALKKIANGGTIHDVTRSTGILRPTYEASVEIREKVYLVEVDEAGTLISKSLEAGED
jgi:hypothetical protein